MDIGLRLAHRLAARAGLAHYADELCGVALHGLARAVSDHEDEKGALLPYAATWMRGAILEEIEREKEHARRFEPVEDALAPAHPAVRTEELSGAAVDTLLAIYVGEELRAQGDAEAQSLTREAFAALHREVGRLPPEDRRLVELRYWDELSWEAVAQGLGVHETTARDRDTRLRERLRDGLVAWDRLRPIGKKKGR
jgi:RNA polymerase sigma factor for flagellar operon FliA